MRPKGHPKQQHYVPKLLLRGFAMGRNEQIYAFDKTASTVFRTAIRNVAAETGFYDITTPVGLASLEPSLGTLESDCAPLINRIRQDRSLAFLTQKDREILALFAMVQHQRTLNFRELISKMNVDLAARLKQIGFDPSRVEGFKEFTDDDLRRFSLRSIEEAHQFVPHILDKAWLLLQTDPSDGFYIGDNPISLQNLKEFGFYGNIGFAVPGIEIYMPISSELTIAWFSQSYIDEFSAAVEKAAQAKLIRPIDAFRIDRLSKGPREFLEAAESGEPIQGNSKNTMNVNSLQVRYAERFVYSRNDNFELATQMLNDHPDLRSGPRGRVD